MTIGEIGLGAVILGDLLLVTLRFRIPLRRAELIFLSGIVLILSGLGLGVLSRGEFIGRITLLLAVIEIILILGSYILFVRSPPPDPSEFKINRSDGLSDANGSLETDGGSAGSTRRLSQSPCVVSDYPINTTEIDRGTETDGSILARSMSWLFEATPTGSSLTLSFHVEAERFSPVSIGGALIFVVASGTAAPFVMLFGGAIGGVTYLVSGYNLLKVYYEVEEDGLVYDIECDEDCHPVEVHREGHRGASDRILIANIYPNFDPRGQVIVAQPEMECAFGSNWTMTGGVGGRGVGWVSFGPGDLTSQRRNLGTFMWRCIPDASPNSDSGNQGEE